MNVDREILDYEISRCAGRGTALLGLARGWPHLPHPLRGARQLRAALSECPWTAKTPEQLDRVLDRWQRMLSGCDSRTRLYFYLFRQPQRNSRIADDGAARR